MPSIQYFFQRTIIFITCLFIGYLLYYDIGIGHWDRNSSKPSSILSSMLINGFKIYFKDRALETIVKYYQKSRNYLTMSATDFICSALGVHERTMTMRKVS